MVTPKKKESTGVSLDANQEDCETVEHVGIGIMRHNVQEDFAERVRINQHRLSSDLRRRFDYIVCGAGTSGCVVAARLASDLNTQVLLLEAGGSDETDLITDPNVGL
jgi:cysteine synthase